jgi:long-chain acyl-CoA synthetase
MDGHRTVNAARLTLINGLLRAAGRDPEHPAIVCEGRSIRYGELGERIRRVAAAASALGLAPGSHVTLLAPNCLEYVELVAGLSGAGLAVVTANPHLTPTELRAILGDSESQALFVHPHCEEAAREAGVIDLEHVFVIGSSYDAWREKARADATLPKVSEEATFAISYTSGTTGKPKGVMLSHRSRTLTFMAMAGEYGCFGPTDHTVATAPLYHGGGFAYGVAPLLFGGTVTITPKFEPEELLATLEATRASNVFVVPTHVSALFALPKSTLDRRPLADLRVMISNAAPLPQRDKERIVAQWGPGRLFEAYGSTEGGIVSNLRPPDQLRKRDCVGLPFPWTEIGIFDEAGERLPTGETGELYTRSPYHFNGYWKQPEASAAIRRGEWLTAGDLGRIDDEGYLYIVGRSKDMIISGGVNIIPAEVEAALAEFPGIVESAVVGIPDPHWGERVVACVVSEGALDQAALDGHCRENLARFKVPKNFLLVPELPRNPTGKLLRRVLREQAAAELTDSGGE